MPPDLRISRLSSGQDISEAKLKEYKETAKRWVEMGPEVASIEIQNWRQKRRFEEALTIFEQLKAEDKAPIIAFMLNSDQDALIELADALAMRDRGLLPSLDLMRPSCLRYQTSLRIWTYVATINRPFGYWRNQSNPVSSGDRK